MRSSSRASTRSLRRSHGDTLPDPRRPLGIADLDESGKPLFSIRGIQPFHDFPEGPDWWGRDDYKALLAQLPKLGMNFFGLHTYPEGRPNAEPTVWIGPPDEIGEGGEVKAGPAAATRAMVAAAERSTSAGRRASGCRCGRSSGSGLG